MMAGISFKFNTNKPKTPKHIVNMEPMRYAHNIIDARSGVGCGGCDILFLGDEIVEGTGICTDSIEDNNGYIYEVYRENGKVHLDAWVNVFGDMIAKKYNPAGVTGGLGYNSYGWNLLTSGTYEEYYIPGDPNFGGGHYAGDADGPTPDPNSNHFIRFVDKPYYQGFGANNYGLGYPERRKDGAAVGGPLANRQLHWDIYSMGCNGTRIVNYQSDTVVNLLCDGGDVGLPYATEMEFFGFNSGGPNSMNGESIASWESSTKGFTLELYEYNPSTGKVISSGLPAGGPVNGQKYNYGGGTPLYQKDYAYELVSNLRPSLQKLTNDATIVTDDNGYALYYLNGCDPLIAGITVNDQYETSGVWKPPSSTTPYVFSVRAYDGYRTEWSTRCLIGGYWHYNGDYSCGVRRVKMAHSNWPCSLLMYVAQAQLGGYATTHTDPTNLLNKSLEENTITNKYPAAIVVHVGTSDYGSPRNSSTYRNTTTRLFMSLEYLITTAREQMSQLGHKFPIILVIPWQNGPIVMDDTMLEHWEEYVQKYYDILNANKDIITILDLNELMLNSKHTQSSGEHYFWPSNAVGNVHDTRWNLSSNVPHFSSQFWRFPNGANKKATFWMASTLMELFNH